MGNAAQKDIKDAALRKLFSTYATGMQALYIDVRGNLNKSGSLVYQTEISRQMVIMMSTAGGNNQQRKNISGNGKTDANKKQLEPEGVQRPF